MRCMEQAFSFIRPNKRVPYLIWKSSKGIRLRVYGNIPYLVPGHQFCAPTDPDEDCPILTTGQLYGRGGGDYAVPGGRR